MRPLSRLLGVVVLAAAFCGSCDETGRDDLVGSPLHGELREIVAQVVAGELPDAERVVALMTSTVAREAPEPTGENFFETTIDLVEAVARLRLWSQVQPDSRTEVAASISGRLLPGHPFFGSDDCEVRVQVAPASADGADFDLRVTVFASPIRTAAATERFMDGGDVLVGAEVFLDPTGERQRGKFIEQSIALVNGVLEREFRRAAEQDPGRSFDAALAAEFVEAVEMAID